MWSHASIADLWGSPKPCAISIPALPLIPTLSPRFPSHSTVLSDFEPKNVNTSTFSMSSTGQPTSSTSNLQIIVDAALADYTKNHWNRPLQNSLRHRPRTLKFSRGDSPTIPRTRESLQRISRWQSETDQVRQPGGEGYTAVLCDHTRRS